MKEKGVTRKMTLRVRLLLILGGANNCDIGLKAKKVEQVIESLLLASHFPKKIQAFHKGVSFVF